MAELTVHEASVTTASVEIKILTVRGKQVTMGMFRQLKRERLLADDGTRCNGEPWGTVNYHHDCHATEKAYYEGDDHLHVVWQLGGELRQAVVQIPLPFLTYDQRADDWLVAAVAEGWRPQAAEGRIASGMQLNVKCNDCGKVVPVRGTRETDQATGLGNQKWEVEYRSRSLADLKKTAQELPAAAEIWQQIHQAHAEDEQIFQMLRTRWDELVALPQLFIAV